MDNAPHLHLLINHLPIFATALALPLLILALLRKSDAGLTLAACALMTAAGVGAAGSMLTGKAAESEVKPLPGVEAPLIDEHADRAGTAAIVTGVSALVALGLGALALKGTPKPAAVGVLFVLCAVSTALMGLTGQAGGKIRHTEVR